MAQRRPPEVPLDLAEIMFVALSHVIDYLNCYDEYPPGMRDNIKELLEAYERRRDRAMELADVPPAVSRHYTEFVTASLIAWLDMRADREDDTANDFDEWAKELRDGDNA